MGGLGHVPLEFRLSIQINPNNSVGGITRATRSQHTPKPRCRSLQTPLANSLRKWAMRFFKWNHTYARRATRSSEPEPAHIASQVTEDALPPGLSTVLQSNVCRRTRFSASLSLQSTASPIARATAELEALINSRNTVKRSFKLRSLSL